MGRTLTGDRREADDAVLVGKRVELVRLLVGPSVADQAREGDVQRLLGAKYVALEEPLGGILGVRLGEAVRVLLLGDLLPVSEVEGDLVQGSGVGLHSRVNNPDI